MRSIKGLRPCLIAIILFCISGYINAQYNCQAGKNFSMPPPYYSPENLRSDTFDILKYNISLEIGNTFTPQIKGNTAIRFAPKINNRTFIRLDLLKLTIDSVKEGNSLLTYAYNDTILKVNFLAAKNTIDTSTITVYYKGQPQGDPSGWGGFYFDNNGGNQYAYNLGVGFAAKPHNYGRVWFPCFDNFVEHSKYEFNITSDTARRAYCNGQLTADVINLPNRTRTWVMNEQIPTYLASVALAKYREVNWNINTLTGNKPITLVGAGPDTTAMKNGFINLKNCITGFENYFGAYKWNRFGYCLVPFNSGAMEHATNIAYPKAVAGSLAYEAELMAHELSHHWWGDLITCETQEDMWINEGMATFSGYMFLEWQYGKQSYLNAVKNRHEILVHQLHKKENGFRAISGIPHNLTYGDHVYRKGADVAHTLRSYMGDVNFFNACKYAMQQKEFKNINSNELRDLFQASSGLNLTDFFNNWVLNGGWPHFSIDSVKYIQLNQNSYNAVVSIKQKIFGAPALFSNVPLELSFFKADWSRVIQTVTMSGASSTFTLNIPYSPVYCALNYDSKISDATSFENKTIKSAININFPLSKLYLMVQDAGADSSLVRIVHNFVKPDPFKSNPQNHLLSDQHFWKVEGILSAGFHSRARFTYDGTKTLGGYAYLDTLLTKVNGDSIRLFYRENAAADWKLVMNIFKFQTGLSTGFIEIDTLKTGEYTFGNSSDTANIINVRENYINKSNVKIYPNPARQSFKIDLGKLTVKNCKLTVMDVTGMVLTERIVNDKLITQDISNYPKGTYIIKIEEKNKLLYCEKLIIE